MLQYTGVTIHNSYLANNGSAAAEAYVVVTAVAAN